MLKKQESIDEYEVAWEAIPGSSQELALDSRCDHTLFHGTRGSAKTAAQLMMFRQFVGLGYGKFLVGVIFDTEYKHLDDIVTQSKRIFPSFEDGCSFKEAASDYKWVWPTGEELLFRHVKKKKDYQAFHGHEHPYIGWNELTKHPTPDLYDLMMSTNRSSFVPEVHTPKKYDEDGKVLKDSDGNIIYDTEDGNPLPEIPLKVFSTTNPSGIGHNWVKKRFIDCARNGEVVEKEYHVFDPRTQDFVNIKKTQVAIFGSFTENIYLPASYIAELYRLTETNENLRKAWIYGSWDITAGGAFDDLWDSNVHIVGRFKIPRGWYIDRSMDWGSAHPFSVGWFAEANGEEVTLEDGTVFCPERGSIIQFFEWYGTELIGSNKGVGLGPTDVARGIREREKMLIREGWISRFPSAGPADTKKGGNTDFTEETIEQKMSKLGVNWVNPNKTPGARINGLQLFRDRLKAALNGEGPAIYFMRLCKSSIETIPVLPRSEKNIEDVDTDAEDHPYDMVRYRVLKDNNRIQSSGFYV